MKIIILSAMLIAFVSCAHHRDVRPSENGVHTVKLQTEDKNSGYRDAISQAKSYCETKKLKAYTVKESHAYSGDLEEKDYKKGKTIAKIAKGIGSAGFILGGKREQNAGGILGLGGQVADSTLGSGYTYVMQFKCK